MRGAGRRIPRSCGRARARWRSPAAPTSRRVLAPAPLATWVRDAVDALARARARAPLARDLDGAALLGERAALLGLRAAARSRRAAPAACCARPTAGSRLTLARPDDAALIPAWLEHRGVDDGPVAGRRARRCARAAAEELVERARLLGLAAAVAGAAAAAPPPRLRVAARGRARASARAAPRVLDLSSLWAGPLCAQLLGLAGARVVKVESVARPDGARAGPRRLLRPPERRQGERRARLRARARARRAARGSSRAPTS